MLFTDLRWSPEFRQDAWHIAAKSKKFDTSSLSELEVNSAENTIIELRKS